jgi:hypothetical protein
MLASHQQHAGGIGTQALDYLGRRQAEFRLDCPVELPGREAGGTARRVTLSGSRRWPRANAKAR